MSNRINVTHDIPADRVTIELSREDFSRLSDALDSASSYQADAYGSGWDDSTTDGRYEHAEWKHLDRISRRLTKESTKVEERHYRHQTHQKGARRD